MVQGDYYLVAVTHQTYIELRLLENSGKTFHLMKITCNHRCLVGSDCPAGHHAGCYFIDSPSIVEPDTNYLFKVLVILVGFQFRSRILPENKECGKANGQPQHIDEREERISCQQAEGEFEVVEEHFRC